MNIINRTDKERKRDVFKMLVNYKSETLNNQRIIQLYQKIIN
jgi:hypothetical protein